MKPVPSGRFRVLFFVLASMCLLGNWKAQAEDLTIYYQDSFPKYINVADKVEGLCMDIMHAVEERLGGDYTFNRNVIDARMFMPMKRIVQYLAIGKISVFFCMAKNDAREDTINYIEPPLYEVNHVVAVRSGEFENVQSIKDIIAIDGAVLTNYGTNTYMFLEEQGRLKLDGSAESLEQNLTKLLLGRGDFVYFHDIGMYSTLARKFEGAPIDVLPTSFNKYYHYLVVSKKAPAELKGRLEKAVAELEEDGTLAAITSKYKSKIGLGYKR